MGDPRIEAAVKAPAQITYNPVYRVTYEGADPTRGYVYTLAAADAVGDWVLVPRVPTQDMNDAATEVLIDDGHGRYTALNWSEAAAVYASMLTAAPTPERSDG